MKQRGIFEKVPGSGEWWVHWYDQHGRRHREKAGTKSAAIALYHKRKTQALEGRKLPELLRRSRATFGELVHDMLEHCKITHAFSTYFNDRLKAERLKVLFGEERAADTFNPQEIEQRFAQAAEENHWKPASVNRYRSLLSLTFRLGIRNGKLSDNPVRHVKRLRENNARVRFLSDEEEKALRVAIRENCPQRESELDLALHTGLRSGEQYGLLWEHVNRDLRILIVQRSKHGEARHVPLNSTALAALGLLRQLHSDSLSVCGGAKGSRRWFEDARRAAGIRNFRWHDLRHTFASRLVMAGVDLRTVQELLGHKTLAVTLRYAHLAPQHELQAVERLVSANRTATKTATAAVEAFRAKQI